MGAELVKNCIICGCRIKQTRLEVLPDTRLCVSCSEKVGGDYETEFVEDNIGDSVISRPFINKKLRNFDEKHE